jgi:lipopolysaccharide/colanic/teichoic acid biosynthesis glycosyltransferase
MTATKRATDVVLSLLGLVLLSPLLGLVALAIRTFDGPPAIFRQVRLGQRGDPFNILKFRTMRVDAQDTGGQLTIGRDPRVTTVGRWLRYLKLDELPQLLNVLLGEMSLVGPRPEVPRYVRLYEERDALTMSKVLELVPGITDPASIRFRDETAILAEAADPESLYVNVIMPMKVRMNLEYAASATFWSDLGVIVRTLLTCLIPYRRSVAGTPALQPRPIGSAGRRLPRKSAGRRRSTSS